MSLDPNRLLDSLGDRLMYRLAYRNFGDHEALVVNHSVATDNGVGLRWYEIRNPGSCKPPPQPPCSLYQEGTFAGSPPDSSFRWMGSMAMDKAGNIAVGYSKSSASMYPAIYFTGRVPSDPLKSLEGEMRIIDGTGAQTNASNWGDYSSISIDPDDCTFWYTTEYVNASGNYSWNTHIASFRFRSCK